MLLDIERKVLRIIYNCQLYGRYPSIDELCRWTGRNEIRVYQVLNSLSQQKYIQWSKGKPNYIEYLRSSKLS